MASIHIRTTLQLLHKLTSQRHVYPQLYAIERSYQVTLLPQRDRVKQGQRIKAGSFTAPFIAHIFLYSSMFIMIMFKIENFMQN